MTCEPRVESAHPYLAASSVSEDLPEVEEADEAVQRHVDEVVAQGPQLVEEVVPAEGEHAQRAV